MVIRTDTDDKLMTSLARSSMMVIGAVIMIHILERMLPQQVQAQVEPETYGLWYFGPAGHIMNAENGADEQPLYVGEAAPGTLNSDAGWRIYKYEYVIDAETEDMVSGTIRYADGSILFDKVWDDRADYEYS